MSDTALRRAVDDMMHDLAKYVGRVAKNVPLGEPVPPGLVPLLLTDVYATDGSRRASVVFDERAAALMPSLAVGVRSELEAVRALLGEADDLEERARAQDAEALARLVTIAREVPAKLERWRSDLLSSTGGEP